MYHYATFNCVAAKNWGPGYRQMVLEMEGMPVSPSMVACDVRVGERREKRARERTTHEAKAKLRYLKEHKKDRDGREDEVVHYEGGCSLFDNGLG
ncbi:hypothetical protein CYMTET_48949 [Cymbomonas tetramitiformis]|uniref:Uncharacterized protein n=1 Tax=Cymbomonas tetramitiformis TaxID=36881 RepID=A0AAE0EW98_9CHLO|nr:hypothetical protein CYMTET_48949 [Cymbomonas tetramitiformis]